MDLSHPMAVRNLERETTAHTQGPSMGPFMGPGEEVQLQKEKLCISKAAGCCPWRAIIADVHTGKGTRATADGCAKLPFVPCRLHRDFRLLTGPVWIVLRGPLLSDGTSIDGKLVRWVRWRRLLLRC